MTPAWAGVALVAAGMVIKGVIWIDEWVHRRNQDDSNLAKEVESLKKQVDAGRSIWDRSVELGHNVEVLQRTVADVRDILERAIERDDRQRERIGTMKEQLARMEEHHKATDREVVALRANVEALRGWTVNKGP